MTNLLLILAPCLIAQQGPADSQRALLTAVNDAFTANQASFEFGNIKFDYVKGTAASDEAARAGDFEPRYVAEGIYVFDAKLARYERRFSEEDMRQSSHYVGNQISSILDTFRMETNGERTLYDSVSALETSGITRGLKIAAGRRLFDRDFQFPIALGQPDHQSMENLGFLLKEVLKSDSRASIAGLEKGTIHEKRPVVKIDAEFPTGHIVYWVDLDRGAVPLKVLSLMPATDTHSERRDIYYFDDVREVPGRGWLPFKETWWHSVDGSGGQILIKDAEWSAPPKRADFDIVFEKPTTITDEAKAVRYPTNKVWNLAHLPSRSSRGVEKFRVPSITDDQLPKLPGERPSPGSGGLLVLLGLIALGATIALNFWYRRGSHA